MSREFLNGLCAICRDQESSLFKDQIEPQLNALRSSAGAGIGRIVLDYAIQISADDEQGLNIC